MNDEHVLLMACRASPNDDRPRLMYADWLEEHDQPNRAAYIRMQCKLANPTGGTTPNEALVQKSRLVFSTHRAEWDAPFQKAFATDDIKIVYDRGLPSQVRMPLDAFVARGNMLQTDAPTITGLDLAAYHIGDTGAKTLAVSPNLTNLTSIKLSMNGIGSTGVQALAASSHLANLTSLNLAVNGIGNTGAQALAASSHFANLTYLNLAVNGIGNTGAQAVSASPYLTKLTSLNLAGNGIGDSGAQALAASPALGNLTYLNLAVNRIGITGAQALASSPYFRPDMNLVMPDFRGTFANFQRWERNQRRWSTAMGPSRGQC